MKLSVRFKLFLGIGVSLILVFLVGLSSYFSLKAVEEDYKWVDHTEEVIFIAREIINNISEAEADQRGYLLRGNREFSLHYLMAVNDVNTNISKLYTLVKDNPDQVKVVDALAEKLRVKIGVMSDLISIKDGSYNGDGNDKILGTQGRILMEEIRILDDKIVKAEEDLLSQRKAKSERAISTAVLIILAGTALIFLIVIILFTNILKAFKAQIESRNEIKQINSSLEVLVNENEEKNWLLTGLSLLNNRIQGDLSVNEMAENIVSVISEYSKGKIGVIYLNDPEKEHLKLCRGYALSKTKDTRTTLNYSDSWIGQVVKDRKSVVLKGEMIKNLKIQSGLVQTQPLESIVVPFYYNSQLKGVLEIGFTDEISASTKGFIETAADTIGVAIDTAEARETMHRLYNQTQQQAEELESQQEELRVSNEELLTKTELLQASEEELRVQQEELRQINAELEEKARMLESNNEIIVNAKDSLAIKMKELEQTSRYKSEFLANMSHELRTPLNSILILARILRDNKSNHLVEEEVKYASVIFKAGTDLLTLINDILDLSKIESGFIELVPENVSFTEIKEDLYLLFEEVANKKEVNFNVNVDADLPEYLVIDKQRLEQILKNLIANAFKFTARTGTITVSFYKENERVNIAVSDTGIGIELEKQKIIFDAFRQADGSTSREYGGTGLGLSISRELSKLMKADISLESTPGKGSTFILTLNDEEEMTPVVEIKDQPVKEAIPFIFVNTDPIENRPKPVLLIVEDDQIFNDILKEYATNNGFETIQVYDGENVEELVKEHMPNAILLDVMLPGIDGWAVLKKIKANPEITQIPVHMMSAGDFSSKNAIREGANSFIKKPVENEQLDKIFKDYLAVNLNKSNRILLIEDQVIQSDAIKDLFKEKNIEVVQAFSGEESLQKLAHQSFDCIILDLHLPDISGEDLLEKIKSEEAFKNIPVIINTAMELDQEKLQQILKYSNATVLKSVKSGERLIDEVNLFLHKIKEIEKSPLKVNVQPGGDLENKTVLLVDDDMRNVFALSAILDQQGMKVEIANDGIEALEKLEELETVDMVLMDIMMPRLDGYETMKRIRAEHLLRKLPIIALTAKAMKEDRDRCIEAGANDYITKPVDTDQLISLMKIWIS
jgi:CheY-like chemotaxis protein/signal transduction histidine kinase/CHASE3 domain sensor protein